MLSLGGLQWYFTQILCFFFFLCNIHMSLRRVCKVKTKKYTWFCLTNGPDHREGGGTGPLLSSHRWDISRHGVYEGQLWRKEEKEEEEEERRGIKEGKRGILLQLMKVSVRLLAVALRLLFLTVLLHSCSFQLKLFCVFTLQSGLF